MKKINILAVLGIASSLLCGCSSSTKLEKVESGIFVIDEITYVAKEGKTLTEDSKAKYKEYIYSYGNNVVILNSDNSARIYHYYNSGNSYAMLSGEISWSVTEGKDDFEGYHYLYCNIQGDNEKVFTQNTDGEIYYDFYYISRETENIDYAHITYMLVDSYNNLTAK